MEISDIPLDILIPILLFPLIIIPILGIYWYQYRKFGRYTPYLISSFLVIFVAVILSILDVLTSEVPFQGGPFGITAEMSIVFLTLFFYLHFQTLASIQPPLMRFSVIIVLSAIYVGMQIPLYFGFIDRTDPDNANYFILSYLVILAQSGISLFYTVRIAYRNYSKSRSTATRNEFIAMVLIFFTFTGIPVEFILELSGYAGSLLHLIITYAPSIFGLVGFLLFLINYFTNVEYLYSIPIQVHTILWYNTIGTPVYRKKIESDINISEDLLSGAFTAISSILKESLSESAQLSHIDLGYYNVFFGHIDKLGTLAFVCDEGSAFFVHSINRFISTMDDDMKSLLSEDGKIPAQLQEKMDSHLFKMFPFLTIQ